MLQIDIDYKALCGKHPNSLYNKWDYFMDSIWPMLNQIKDSAILKNVKVWENRLDKNESKLIFNLLSQCR